MRKLLRFLVMWLLALALPIQGVAAATMRHCGSDDERARAVAFDQSKHADQHSMPAMPADTAARMHHGLLSHALVGSGEPTHQHASHDKGGCSACASCCSAVALLTTLKMSTTATAGRSTPIAVPTTLSGTFLTDGPDRPPRSIVG